MSEAEFQIVDIGRLEESPLNPRQHYDPEKIKELAESMMGGTGVIEPLVVRPSKNEHLEIIAGSRRYRAAKTAADFVQIISSPRTKNTATKSPFASGAAARNSAPARAAAAG